MTANAGWVSQYFYRGILQKTSSASAGLDVTYGALSVGTWLADVGDGAEVDLYGSVGGDVGEGSLSAVDNPVLQRRQQNSGGPELDYWFFGLTAEHEGFYGTYGAFGNDFEGGYGEVGYGFSASELDFTISGILSDSDLSGLVDGDNMPTPGLTLVFGVGKTFNLNPSSP